MEGPGEPTTMEDAMEEMTIEEVPVAAVSGPEVEDQALAAEDVPAAGGPSVEQEMDIDNASSDENAAPASSSPELTTALPLESEPSHTETPPTTFERSVDATNPSDLCHKQSR